MSNDPFDPGAGAPRPEPTDPRGFQPGAPLPAQPGVPLPLPGGDVAAARARVQPAAICLIVVGVINLLLGLGSGVVGAVYANFPDEMAEDVMQKQNPQMVKEMQQRGWSIRTFLNVYVYGGYTGAVLGLLTAILAIVGGSRMLALKSYGLAMFASVLVAIPFISCSGCCGLGEGIGIWSVVVLMNEEVKAAFRLVAESR
jgi:hypothetical protein